MAQLVSNAADLSKDCAEGMPGLVIPFSKICLDDINIVGGKNASLGEMIRQLTGAGVCVPGGFATRSMRFIDTFG